MLVKRLMLLAGPALTGLLAAGLWAAAWAHTGAPAYNSYASGGFFFPPYPADSDRIGIGVRGSILDYAYDPALRPGWYIDWDAKSNPPHPAGAEYARTIRFTVNTNSCGMNKIPASQRSQIVPSISGAALASNLRANPGAVWMIGNEPDSIYNCTPIMPTLYAEVYHEFYTFIKSHDPSAKVVIAAIVQPSPLRLEYLDKVLNHYQATYGEKLPTDLWNIHLYAFPERAGGAGAGVPPDASSSVGWTYSWAQTVDLNLMAQNLRIMRQWLADRGERDKPLIITEFGQVIPEDYELDGLKFTPQVSRDYLVGSITHFLTATDPLIGYPADGNRLVQAWTWYALYDGFYGGDLINKDGTLTLAGQALVQIIQNHLTHYADLYPAPLATPYMPPAGSNAISAPLTVQVNNYGNASVSSAPVRFEQHDVGSGRLLASQVITLSQVFTRYAGVQPQVSAQWTLTPGRMYTLTFEIDPARTINQARRSSQRLVYEVGWIPDLAVTSLETKLAASFLWTAPVTTPLTMTIGSLGNLTTTTGALQVSMTGMQGSLYLAREFSIPPLPPGASTSLMAALTFPTPGHYRVTVSITPRSGLDQRPDNNTQSLDILAATTRQYIPFVQKGNAAAAAAAFSPGAHPPPVTPGDLPPSTFYLPPR